MKVDEFPGCCTARILHDFGGTQVSAGIKDKVGEKAIRTYVINKLTVFGAGRMAVVITNSEQKTANKVLRELGFSHSPWISKSQHGETKIRLWWFPPGRQIKL